MDVHLPDGRWADLEAAARLQKAFVEVRDKDEVVEAFLDTEPGPGEAAAWLTAAEAPPARSNREAEPMMLRWACFAVPDVFAGARLIEERRRTPEEFLAEASDLEPGVDPPPLGYGVARQAHCGCHGAVDRPASPHSERSHPT